MNCRSLSYALPLVNLPVFLFYIFIWRSEERGLAFAAFESFPELRLAFVTGFLKKVSGWQEQGGDCSSLAPWLSGSITAGREIALSFYGLGAFCCSFLAAFSYCFMQIHVIFTVFKERKVFGIFCEV